MNIEVSKVKEFIARLEVKLENFIWNDIEKSELFGQLRDQYMTKMNFLWCGRDILITEKGKWFDE